MNRTEAFRACYGVAIGMPRLLKIRLVQEQRDQALYQMMLHWLEKRSLELLKRNGVEFRSCDAELARNSFGSDRLFQSIAPERTKEVKWAWRKLRHICCECNKAVDRCEARALRRWLGEHRQALKEYTAIVERWLRDYPEGEARQKSY